MGKLQRAAPLWNALIVTFVALHMLRIWWLLYVGLSALSSSFIHRQCVVIIIGILILDGKCGRVFNALVLLHKRKCIHIAMCKKFSLIYQLFCRYYNKARELLHCMDGYADFTANVGGILKRGERKGLLNFDRVRQKYLFD